MKKTFWLLTAITLSCAICNCKPLEVMSDKFDTNFKMVNESGVDVEIKAIGISSYGDFEQFFDGVTIADKDAYEWSVYGNGPLTGNSAVDVVRICFDNTVIIEYSGEDSYYNNSRDPRVQNNYVAVKHPKYDFHIYVYTFTEEDYQNALDQQQPE